MSKSFKYGIIGAGSMGREHIRNVNIIDEAEIVALSDPNDDSINHLRLRLWHYYWSSFYFHKKHYGYLRSFLLHISKFLRFSVLKYSYMLVGNTRSYKVSKAKADGLFHQILNKDSSFRIDL